MTATSLRLVCLFALLTIAAPATSRAQNLVSYDKFDGPFVNADKWAGFEDVSEDEGQNLEAVRQIAANRLSLMIRASGDPNTDDGTHTAVTALAIRNPRGISQIALDVVPTVAATINNCLANSEAGLTGIGAAGAFYHEETNFPDADVYGIIVVGKVAGIPTPANRLEVRGLVFSEETSSGDTIFIGGADLGTIVQTATARLSLEWDPNTDQIKFQVNNRPIETVQGPASEGFPDEDFKVVAAYTNVENCTNQQTIGSARGSIDNVSIKRLP